MFSFLRKNNNEILGQWRTVAELKVGQSIAVPKNDVLNSHTTGKIDSREWMGGNDVDWDEIESIEYVGTEQVWDIEVEGTHNFVGNNIFAHNTYLNGSLGVGTSTPWAKLSVAGSDTSSTLIGADALSGFTGNLIDLKLASTTKFSVSGTGFGTTTVSGLNIAGSATTTSNVGINLSGGCFAINGTCVSGGAGGNVVDTLSATLGAGTDAGGLGMTNLGIVSISPVVTSSTTPLFVVATSTSSELFSLDASGRLTINNYFYGTSTNQYGLQNITTISNVSTTTDSIVGARNSVVANGTGVGGITGNYNLVNYNGTGIATAVTGATNYVMVSSGSATNAYGSRNYVSNSIAVPITNAYGVYSAVDDAITNNISNAYGIYTGEIQGANAYGMYISDSITGATDGYALYSAATENSYFAGNVGIGTTSPYAKLSVQATANQTNPVFEVASSSNATKFLSVSATGFGTTTLSGLNISGSATTTSNVGINLSGGCFAIGGTCIGAGSASSASTTLLADSNTWTGVNKFGTLNLSSVAVNSLLSTDASGNIVATSTPTFGNFNATSTTATSTISTGGLVVGGTQFVVQQNSGNVGIGIATPGAKLHVSGNTYITSGSLFLDTIGHYSGGSTPLNIGTTNQLSLSTSGIIGIGTSTPTNKLTITDTASSQLSLSAGAGIAQWAFRNAGGNFYLSTTTVAGTATSTLPAVTIIGSSGYVGISNSSPSAVLDVKGVSGDSYVQKWTNSIGNTIGAMYQLGGNGGYFYLNDGANNEVISLRGDASATYINNSGNFGVGTTTPQYKLTASSATAPQLSLSAGAGIAQWVTRNAGGNLYFATTTVAGTATTSISAVSIIGSTGNMGIGTSNPSAKLQVLNGGITVGNAIDSGWGNIRITGNYIFSDAVTHYIQNADNSDVAFKLWNGSADVIPMTLKPSGNVGIGTTTPYANLTIWGSATGKALEVVNSASTTLLSVSATGFGTTTVSGLNIAGSATTTSNVGINLTDGCFAVNGVCVGGGTGSGSGTVNSGVFGQLAFYGANGTTVSGTSTITIATTTNSGRVGIATSTNLNATLTLQGAAGLDILRIATSTSGANVLTISQWGGFTQKISSTSAFSIQRESGVPVFEIDTTSDINSGIDITASAGQSSNLFNLYSSAGAFLSGFTSSGGLFMNISSTTAINLYDGSGAAAFVVDSTGKKVGIGTSTLTYNLNVSGDSSASYIARINNANTANTADGLLISLGVANASRTTGNYFIGFSDGGQTVAGKIQGGASAVAYTTTAADLAEYFRASDLDNKPEKGDIVMLDANNENSVKVADISLMSGKEPIGVISTNPGFVGNGPICYVGDQNCDTEYDKYNVLVAMVGQVPVKVSDENGEVVPGDYLTLSSTTPGTAVKMIDGGYTIGMAMTYASSTEVALEDGSEMVPMVRVFIKAGWREVDMQTENGLASSLMNRVLGYMKSLGLEIGNNFVKIVNLAVDKITADRVETKQLCIEDVCVDKTQLQALLLSSGQSGTIISNPATTTDPIITDPIVEPIVETPATSTDPVVEVPPVVEPVVETPLVVEPAPEPIVVEPAPEPVVEPAPAENP